MDVLPAQAGMILANEKDKTNKTGSTRASGDDPFFRVLK